MLHVVADCSICAVGHLGNCCHHSQHRSSHGMIKLYVSRCRGTIPMDAKLPRNVEEKSTKGSPDTKNIDPSTGFIWKMSVQMSPDWYVLSSGWTLKNMKSFIALLDINSPNAAYIRQWTGSALVHIMACCLFGTKPLTEPMLTYYQLHPLEQNQVKSNRNTKLFKNVVCKLLNIQGRRVNRWILTQ